MSNFPIKLYFLCDITIARSLPPILYIQPIWYCCVCIYCAVQHCPPFEVFWAWGLALQVLMLFCLVFLVCGPHLRCLSISIWFYKFCGAEQGEAGGLPYLAAMAEMSLN